MGGTIGAWDNGELTNQGLWDYQLRLLPLVPEKLGSCITPQTTLSFPRNGESSCSPAIVLCLVLQILSPAPSFAISRVYASTVLPLPSFFLPTCVFVTVRGKLIPHSSSCQACWKRLCRESGARIPHGSPDLWSSEVSFPSLLISVVDEEPLQVFWGARTRWFHQAPSRGSYSRVPCSVCSLKDLCIASSKTLRFRGDNLSLNLHINNLHSYCKACYLKS